MVEIVKRKISSDDNRPDEERPSIHIIQLDDKDLRGAVVPQYSYLRQRSQAELIHLLHTAIKQV